jgi:hypothetical protein
MGIALPLPLGIFSLKTFNSSKHLKGNYTKLLDFIYKIHFGQPCFSPLRVGQRTNCVLLLYTRRTVCLCFNNRQQQNEYKLLVAKCLVGSKNKGRPTDDTAECYVTWQPFIWRAHGQWVQKHSLILRSYPSLGFVVN